MKKCKGVTDCQHADKYGSCSKQKHLCIERDNRHCTAYKKAKKK